MAGSISTASSWCPSSSMASPRRRAVERTASRWRRSPLDHPRLRRHVRRRSSLIAAAARAYARSSRPANRRGRALAMLSAVGATMAAVCRGAAAPARRGPLRAAAHHGRHAGPSAMTILYFLVRRSTRIWADRRARRVLRQRVPRAHRPGGSGTEVDAALVIVILFLWLSAGYARSRRSSLLRELPVFSQRFVIPSASSGSESSSHATGRRRTRSRRSHVSARASGGVWARMSCCRRRCSSASAQNQAFYDCDANRDLGVVTKSPLAVPSVARQSVARGSLSALEPGLALVLGDAPGHDVSQPPRRPRAGEYLGSTAGTATRVLVAEPHRGPAQRWRRRAVSSSIRTGTPGGARRWGGRLRRRPPGGRAPRRRPRCHGLVRAAIGARRQRRDARRPRGAPRPRLRSYPVPSRRGAAHGRARPPAVGGDGGLRRHVEGSRASGPTMRNANNTPAWCRRGADATPIGAQFDIPIVLDAAKGRGPHQNYFNIDIDLWLRRTGHAPHHRHVRASRAPRGSGSRPPPERSRDAISSMSIAGRGRKLLPLRGATRRDRARRLRRAPRTRRAAGTTSGSASATPPARKAARTWSRRADRRSTISASSRWAAFQVL